jgi:hypothetical protein
VLTVNRREEYSAAKIRINSAITAGAKKRKCNCDPDLVDMGVGAPVFSKSKKSNCKVLEKFEIIQACICYIDTYTSANLRPRPP